MIKDGLYKLTKNGLGLIGYIDTDGWNIENYNLMYTVLNNAEKVFYFSGRKYGSGGPHRKPFSDKGIYEMDLADLTKKSEPILITSSVPRIISISPDDKFLLIGFYYPNNSSGQNKYNAHILDLTTGKLQKLLDDYSGVIPAGTGYGGIFHSIVWINNHQFIYSSTKGSNAKRGEVSKKPILYLYDINSQEKKDLHMDGYYPGALSPDGKWLLLEGNGKTILYNVYNDSIKVIANKRLQIEGAIWLPDGKGFLYSDSTLEEFFDALIFTDAHYGLYYYSLEKKKSIRLEKYNNLKSGAGFIVPSGIDIKLPDTKINRMIKSGERNNHNIIKIYNW